MPEIRIEELFERYRSAGDLDALAAVFDRTANQLLKVARHLARDEAQAEDLVQATFLAAIEHAERFEASRELVPWLVGILTNKAQVARAMASRAADPERLAERSTEDPAHDTEIREFMATLERALERVPDAYRQVLRIHLAEGKGAEEIAHEVKRPAGTVRVQLHRGLKALRRLLPAGFALGGIVVLTAPRGLAAIRASVLGRASALAKAGAAGVTGVSTAQIVGGVLVGKKIAIAVGVVLMAAGALWFAKQELTSADEGTVADVSPPAGLESAERIKPDLANDSGSAQRETATSPAIVPADDPYGSLEVEVDWSDGSLAAGVSVLVVPKEEHQPDQHAENARTDEHGRFTIPRIHEGRAEVILDRVLRFERTTVLTVGRGRNFGKVVAPELRNVGGRVLDADGKPVRQGTVWALNDEVLGSGLPFAQTADDGTFHIRSIHPRLSIFATARNLGSSEAVKVDSLSSGADGKATAELHLIGEDSTLEGVVTDATGAPVAGARVWTRSVSSVRGGDFVHWPPTLIQTNAVGEFRVFGVHEPGPKVLVDAAGFAAWSGFQKVEVGKTAHLDVKLERGFTVEGTVKNEDGTPSSGSSVTQRFELGMTAFPPASTRTDAEGHYSLEHLAAGEITLSVKSERAHASRTLTGQSGDTLHWSPTFSTGLVIRGRAEDQSGNPLTGWRVSAQPVEQGGFNPADARTDAQGHFEIRGCGNGPHVVNLFAPNMPNASSVTRDSVRPDGADLVLVVTPESRPSASVTGRILDADGAPLAQIGVMAQNQDRHSYGHSTTDSDGRFQVDALIPGPTLVEVQFPKTTGTWLGRVDLVAEEVHDLGTMTLERRGRLELTLHREDGGKYGKDAVYLFDEFGYVSLAGTKDGVLFKSGELRPGRYRLDTTLPGTASEMQFLDVQPGETTRLERTVRAGTMRQIEFHVTDGGARAQKLQVIIRRDGGDVVFDRESGFDNLPTGDPTYTVIAGFAVGRYTYEATSKEGLSAKGSFEVADLIQLREPMTITLVRDR